MTRTCGAIFALILGICATPGFADNALADRIGSLMGQERQTLDVVPERQLSALTVAVSAPADSTTAEAAPAVAAVAAPAPVPVAAAPAADPATDPATVAAATDSPLAAAVAQAVPSGDAEWQCMTTALYFEARGESLRGVAAVAEVILNRRDSGLYPRSVCGVVHQAGGGGCQFSYNCDGLSDAIGDRAAWSRVGQVARAMLDGAPRTLTGGATHYHTTAVHPSWANRFPQTAQIGTHLFYRQPVRTASN